MMYKVLLCLLLTVCVCPHAQSASADSVASVSAEPIDSAYMAQIDSILQEYEAMQKQREVEKVVEQYEAAMLKKEMSLNADGVLPLARGLLLSWTDHGFVKQPARFQEKDDALNWADYGVAGAPLVANWVMKAAGVKSRSKLERMLTANAMALGLSFGVTQLLKNTVKETRPDLSDQHAFPSGHTSFAFVSASVLSREYGYLSPWVSVGSYTTATATQLLRLKHHKHWVNDLYMGAGIGMVSTNLAYFLTDKIFGVDAVNKPELRRKDVLRLMKFNAQPSGISVVAGTEVGNRKIRFDDAMIKLGSALSTGVDVEWHTSPYIALGLQTRAVTTQTKVFGTSSIFTGENLNYYHLDVSAKLSTPITLGNRLGTRVFAGTRIIDGVSLTDGVATYSIPDETKFECGLGLSYECLDTGNYVWGFNCDYYYTFSDYMKNRYCISSIWKILF